MSQVIPSFTVSGRAIELPGGYQFTFLGKVIEAIGFDDTVVVLIDWMVTNRNVFGISREGKQLWQIKEQTAIYDDNPCTYLSQRGDYAFVNTFDGLELLVEPRTGKVVKERRERGVTTEWVNPS